MVFYDNFPKSKLWMCTSVTRTEWYVRDGTMLGQGCSEWFPTNGRSGTKSRPTLLEWVDINWVV